MVWGVFVCPKTIIEAKTDVSNANGLTLKNALTGTTETINDALSAFEYRVSYSDEPITVTSFSEAKGIAVVGSVLGRQCSFANLRLVVFGGSVDGYGSGKTKQKTPGEDDYSQKNSNGGSLDNTNISDDRYFDNDHMAQG